MKKKAAKNTLRRLERTAAAFMCVLINTSQARNQGGGSEWADDPRLSAKSPLSHQAITLKFRFVSLSVNCQMQSQNAPETAWRPGYAVRPDALGSLSAPSDP